MYFPGFVYTEILRCVNLESLIDKNNVGTHRLNYLLPDKRHTEYNIRRENVYPLPVIERMHSVTPLYRVVSGLYTTASKQVY